MNGLAAIQPQRQLDPQILLATLLVNGVAQDIQSLAPQVFQEGTILVSQARVTQWRLALQGASEQLRQLVVPLIFPPPLFAIFANQADRQIRQALATLAALPAPPQIGQVALSLDTTLALLIDLQQALALLLRALTA